MLDSPDPIPGTHDDLSTFAAEMPSDDYKLQDAVRNIKSLGQRTDEKLDGIRNGLKVPVLGNSFLETKRDPDDDDTSDISMDHVQLPDLDAIEESPQAQLWKRRIGADEDSLHDKESELDESMTRWNHEVGNYDREDEEQVDDELEKEGDKLGESDGTFESSSSFMETSPSGSVATLAGFKKFEDDQDKLRERNQYKLDHSRLGWLQNMTSLLHRSKELKDKFTAGHEKNMLKLKVPSSFLEFSTESSLREGEREAEKAFDQMLAKKAWLEQDRVRLRSSRLQRQEHHAQLRAKEQQAHMILINKEKARRQARRAQEEAKKQDRQKAISKS